MSARQVALDVVACLAAIGAVVLLSAAILDALSGAPAWVQYGVIGVLLAFVAFLSWGASMAPPRDRHE